MSAQDVPPSERMKVLELKAQAIRSRLLRAIDTLENRRHQAALVGSYAKSIAKPAVVTLLGVVVVVGVSAIAVRHLLGKKKERTLAARASRMLRRLDLVEKPSMGARVFEKAALSLVTIAANALVRQITTGLVADRAGPRLRLAPQNP